jgi:hypothetical protein
MISGLPANSEGESMSQRKIQVSGWGIAGAYLFLFFLFLWPIIDLSSNVFPFQLGNVQWRYGFMGLMAAYLQTPILALLLAMVLALVLRQVVVLRFLSILSFVGIPLLILVIVIFALDVLQLRDLTPAERLSAFKTGAVLAELKHLSAIAVLALLGIGGWKTTAAMTQELRSTKGSDTTAEAMKAQRAD